MNNLYTVGLRCFTLNYARIAKRAGTLAHAQGLNTKDDKITAKNLITAATSEKVKEKVQNGFQKATNDSPFGTVAGNLAGTAVQTKIDTKFGK